jgi:MerR family mercuric resistance operon transcriptional regulator/MerR family gold-responsive transcriptional activator of gol and ges genes
MNAELTIGRVARKAGVNIQTVRYYERRGLLSPDAYRDSGYRLYTDEAVRKLQFIRNAQELGFTLEEIAGLLRLRIGRRTRCGDVRKKAETKLYQVNEKIGRLQSMRRVLTGLIHTCRKRGSTDACPILRSLEGGKR